jgi:signal transduction histidine kinase
MPQPSVDELRELPLFAGESPEAVEWIASRMEERCYETGTVVSESGAPARDLIVILEGEIHFRRRSDDTILIAPVGLATGVLPFSRMKAWTGRGWAARMTRIATLDVSHFRELVYRAPVLAQRLVSEMTDRAREFTRIEESANRLLALGKLSAGLAHELNNPASAAVRSSARLRELLMERRKLALTLHSVVLPAGVSQIMLELSTRIAGCVGISEQLGAMERADRESDLDEWLESVNLPGDLAGGLVDAGITSADLHPLAALVSPELLLLAVRVLAADHEIFCLTVELEDSARRISDLVQAVKTYSYMDQNPNIEVDIREGIEVTLLMFQHQLGQDIQVTRQFAPDLPRLHANGGALNQIWTNLIDNALCAMKGLPAEGPKVLSLRTCAEPNGILVEVGDNGPGIPAHLQHRIFEPFFTTKAVGEGTGLGLDIVQRIIRMHNGSIRLESAHGRTVFQVRLPVQPAPA